MKDVFARGHTSRVATGALAEIAQDPGPLRGTSTTCPPASIPVTTPFETPTPTPDALELSFEAVAVEEFAARVAGRVGVIVAGGVLGAFRTVEVVLVATGEVVVRIELCELVGAGATAMCEERWDRADDVIEKSITSRSTGLDHITSCAPQRGELVRVIGVPRYREVVWLVSGRKTQAHKRHRRANRWSSHRSEVGEL
ncbi:MAG: hypothetical protein ACYC5Z_05205 [Acidimicrobiales bacterium]